MCSKKEERREKRKEKMRRNGEKKKEDEKRNEKKKEKQMRNEIRKGKRKRGGDGKQNIQWPFSFGFRERTSSFSLGSWEIRPSDSFATRRRVVLLGEDNAWTTVLGSFFKLLEVGVLSYLFYTLFKCFVMFVLA